MADQILAGNVAKKTYPSGDVVTIARATDGQVTGVTQTPAGGSAQTIASGVTYEPFGPLAGLANGNGLGLTRTYDQDYRLTGISVAPASGSATLGLGFSWQPDGRLLSVTDPAGTGRAASFGYTPSGRVASGAGPWGSYAYAFDAAGNRTQSGTASAPVVATVATASNQVTQTSQGGVTQRTLTYGTGGNLSTDAHAGGVSYSYIYSANKRMITAKQNGAIKGSYAYDFQGARVWRETYGTGAAQTAYVYDEAGHLLAEHNAVTGAVNREYVWIDDLPVALINISGGTETTDFIHTGQIYEPLAVTNSGRALVWNAYVDPFGIATTFTTPTTTLDMRLPGQSFQLEPNSLHQNHWRDYDPSLGRYVEADPLGINAGQNVYVYVNGDPLNADDVKGLIEESANVSKCSYQGPGGSIFQSACDAAYAFCKRNKMIMQEHEHYLANDNETGFPPRSCGRSRLRCQKIASDLGDPSNGIGAIRFPDGALVQWLPRSSTKVTGAPSWSDWPF